MSKIVCDLKNCSGCLACVVACIDQHYDETVKDAVSCRLYEKVASERTGMVCFKTRTCLHCEDAECMKACPAEALVRINGFVVPLKEKCIGCKACAKACPHAVPQFDNEGKLVKCDGCVTRVMHGMEPACVRACCTGCLKLEQD